MSEASRSFRARTAADGQPGSDVIDDALAVLRRMEDQLSDHRRTAAAADVLSDLLREQASRLPSGNFELSEPQLEAVAFMVGEVAIGARKLNELHSALWKEVRIARGLTP